MKGVDYLLDGDVTVVRASLDVHRGLEHLLSADELARAGRFHRPIHRHRFVEARAVLRTLLGSRLERDPARIGIAVGEHGKPRLDPPDPLSFNIAHSDEAALFAFTATGEVGVDIERIRPLDPVRLSTTCFSSSEQEALRGVDPSRQLTTFFDGWVRKEAVIKADGRGVSLGLETFSVTLRGPARLVAPPPGDARDRWTLAAIDAGPGARAAVAVKA